MLPLPALLPALHSRCVHATVAYKCKHCRPAMPHSQRLRAPLLPPLSGLCSRCACTAAAAVAAAHQLLLLLLLLLL
jgi:hypothetical protein